ncbi:hypothetical protein LJC56_08535 [Christensenellaceae bacterium OttesenSCG-928-K19]|nr:hypothetical protein [Christensenellaceae bacterium OttesenSCG-928-K19]
METEKLYSPINCYLRDDNIAAEERYDNIDWRDPLSHEDAFGYMDSIELALRRNRDSFDSEMGLAEYVPDSLEDIVTSLFPRIEHHGNKLWCVADITLTRPITPGETGELSQWWTGQLSDGWGEGLEQREIKVKDGDLYIEPWMPDNDFRIYTQSEFDAYLGINPTKRETPAQAALHEPDIYDDEATVALRDQLIQRLDENLWKYFDNLRGQDVPGMSSEIAAVMGAHYYLAEIHNFHTSELEYLLQFRDPLAVVAHKFEAAGMDDYSDIMWDIFDRQDALQGDYERMPDAGSEEALKQELFRRLDSNLSEYCEGLMDVDKRELIGMAEEIAARYAVRDYLKDCYDFREGDVQYLLGFKHPLALIAKHWPGTGDGLVDVSGVVQDVLDDRDDHGRFLKADAPAAQSATKGRQGEKASVLEQIRQARENPQPHKDAPGKSREPEL